MNIGTFITTDGGCSGGGGGGGFTSDTTHDIRHDSITSALPDMEERKQVFLNNLQVTSSEVKRIMNVDQRTDEWLQARKGRITASNYGSAACHNPYCNHKALLKNLLWSTFKGNRATEYGTKNEPVASDIYERFMAKYLINQEGKFSVSYPGLIICEKFPWLACSPDGLPLKGMLRWLLEIKCPFSKKFYPSIPHYYYDQIQGIMGILKLPYADFVVWTPEKTQIRRYNFDPSYWSKVLFPRLQTFYMEEYLPRIILKNAKKLKDGELEPTERTLHIKPPKSSVLDDFDFILGDSGTAIGHKRKTLKECVGEKVQKNSKKQKKVE